MGGIATDLQGRSSLPGLYAVGECACTGLHGANRLASNSLTECFVFSRRAAEAAGAEPAPDTSLAVPPWRFDPPNEETRDAVWSNAGPRRDPLRLEQLRSDAYVLARVVADCALARNESRGSHRRMDARLPDPKLDGIHFIYAADGSIRAEPWR
jgi:L-aspartate oxidase